MAYCPALCLSAEMQSCFLRRRFKSQMLGASVRVADATCTCVRLLPFVVFKVKQYDTTFSPLSRRVSEGGAALGAHTIPPLVCEPPSIFLLFSPLPPRAPSPSCSPTGCTSCQAAIEKLTWKDRLPGYFINVSSILFMVGAEAL